MHCPATVAATPWFQPPSPHQHNGHHIPTHPHSHRQVAMSLPVLTQTESKGQGKEMTQRGSARAQDALVAVITDDYGI